jgi:hypothetical protein
MNYGWRMAKAYACKAYMREVERLTVYLFLKEVKYLK